MLHKHDILHKQSSSHPNPACTLLFFQRQREREKQENRRDTVYFLYFSQLYNHQQQAAHLRGISQSIALVGHIRTPTNLVLFFHQTQKDDYCHLVGRASFLEITSGANQRSNSARQMKAAVIIQKQKRCLWEPVVTSALQAICLSNR